MNVKRKFLAMWEFFVLEKCSKYLILFCVFLTWMASFQWVTVTGRVQLKRDGTRWRTAGEVKGKLADGVGSQYPSHYLGTWFIQHYYRWCAHIAASSRLNWRPCRFKWTHLFHRKTKSGFCVFAITFQTQSNRMCSLCLFQWWQVDKVSPIKLFDENKTLSGLNLRHLLYQQNGAPYAKRVMESVFNLWKEGKIKPVVDSTWALEDVSCSPIVCCFIAPFVLPLT